MRERLAKGGYSVGGWMQIPNSSVAEIMGDSGVEWVAVDLEHGNFSSHQLPDIFRAIELGQKAAPFARIMEPSRAACYQALEAGAVGIIIPQVTNASKLMEIIDACRLPPLGNRSVGYSRANLFGDKFNRWLQEAQTPFMVAMIENVEAAENIGNICDVKGLDAVLIGPYDLSSSLGLPGNFTEPKYLAMLSKIQLIASQKGIPIGIHVIEPDILELRNRIEAGYRFLAYSVDSVMLRKGSKLEL